MRAFIAVRKYMIQASPSSPSRELEEVKERIKALNKINEENESMVRFIIIFIRSL